MEMKCLRIYRISNEEIRRVGMGVQNKLSGRVENCVLRWFGHVERMPERLYDSGVQGR